MQRSGIRHHRQDGQGREPAEQRAAAVSRRAEHDRRAQDHPVEIAAHQHLIPLDLGAGEIGRGGTVDPDRREMDDPAHGGGARRRRTGRRRRRRARRASKSRGPSCNTPAQLITAPTPARCGSQSAGCATAAMSSAIQRAAGMPRAAPCDMAGDTDDLMPGLDQAGDNGAADQPGRPRHQHAHSRLSVFSRGPNALLAGSTRTGFAPHHLMLGLAVSLSACEAGEGWAEGQPRVILRAGIKEVEHAAGWQGGAGRPGRGRGDRAGDRARLSRPRAPISRSTGSMTRAPQTNSPMRCARRAAARY